MKPAAIPAVNLDPSHFLTASSSRSDFAVWCNNLGEPFLVCGTSGADFLAGARTTVLTRPTIDDRRPITVSPSTPAPFKALPTIAADIDTAVDDTAPPSTPSPPSAPAPSAFSPPYKYERDSSNQLTAAGWAKFDIDEARFETLAQQRADLDARTFQAILAAMSTDMKNKLATQPSYPGILTSRDIVAFRLLLNQLLNIGSSALQSISTIRTFISFKLNPADHIDTDYKRFLESLSAVEVAFGIPGQPGALNTQAIAAAIFLQGVPRPDHQPFVDQFLATHDDFIAVTVAHLKTSYATYLNNAAIDANNAGSPDPSKKSKKKEKPPPDLNAGAILGTPAIDPSPRRGSRLPRIPKGDFSLRSESHPYCRPPGDLTRPTPWVQGTPVCSHCYANGWLYNNHNTWDCVDAIWAAQRFRKDEPFNSSTHPNFILPASPISPTASANKKLAIRSLLTVSAGTALQRQAALSRDDIPASLAADPEW